MPKYYTEIAHMASFIYPSVAGSASREIFLLVMEGRVSGVAKSVGDWGAVAGVSTGLDGKKESYHWVIP